MEPTATTSMTLLTTDGRVRLTFFTTLTTAQYETFLHGLPGVTTAEELRQLGHVLASRWECEFRAEPCD